MPGARGLVKLAGFLARFLFLLLSQGLAAAATSVGTGPRQVTLVVVLVPPGGPPVSVLGQGLVRITAADTRLPIAGAQTGGTPGLAGGTALLPACGASPCTDRFRFAAPATLRAGDFGEQLTLSVTQPSRVGGTSTGFDVDLAVHTNLGWFFGRAYVATGLSPLVGGALVYLVLVVDLLTPFVPTVLSVQTALNTCSAVAGCP